MKKTALWLILLSFVLAGISMLWRGNREPAPYEPKIAWNEPAPVCPWREPVADMQQWFPNAKTHQEETCILSHLRVELEKAFGQAPEQSDLAPTLFRILDDSGASIGTVMTRRVKGEHGAIEIAVPIDGNGAVFGLKIQRMREPEAIAAILLEPAYQRKLINLHEREPQWPEPIKVSANAIRKGVQELRTLYSACSKQAQTSSKKHH